MVSFYRKFLPGISQLTASLSDLLRKDTREPLSFSDSNLDKFKNIKAILTNKPLLRLPDKDRTFVLQSDASTDGLGAVLTQYYDNCPIPVAYASMKLLDREKNYSTIEKECLAIVCAVQTRIVVLCDGLFCYNHTSSVLYTYVVLLTAVPTT